jgi:hypothetical protein
MTEIKAFGNTYVGTAEGDHGVFTNPKTGTVYAGKIAGGSACIGVATRTDGTTTFVQCDADGKEHGRELGCAANGDTGYRLCEHGNLKEHAVLYADGTCKYNGKACRANFAPFAALQAMVLPIKARPPLVPPQPPLCRIRSHRLPVGPIASQSVPSPPSRSHRLPVGPIGHCFCHSQELATSHARKVRARLRHQ